MKFTLALVVVGWTFAAPAAFYFKPPTTVYHELAAPPIGATAYIAYGEYPRLSANGRAIIYREVQANLTYVHVLDFDGFNNRVVDVITNAGYRAYALNADGSRHASLGDYTLRTGSTATSPGVEVLAAGGLNSPALSDDGSKVYFCVKQDTTTTGPSPTPLARGLYEMNANGSGRRLIASHGATAATLGVPADDNVRFDFAAASANASRLVFAATINGYGDTNAIMGVNLDGSGLHVIRYVGSFLNDVTISRDGNTVAWFEYSGPVRVADFAGGNVRALIQSGEGPQNPLTLTANGSHLMEGSGRIYRTDGLGLQTVLYYTGAVIDPVLTAGSVARLSPDGQRGVFVGGRRYPGNQVCTFEFDPYSSGSAPNIAGPNVTPNYVRFSSASMATASATVTMTGTNRGVGTVSFRAGRLDNTFYLSVSLYDNGQIGDPIAGDSRYVNNELRYIYNDPADLGPRTLRFHAESTDASGYRHATTAEYGNFFVVNNTPPSSGGPVFLIPPAPTTNSSGQREIRFYGASFAPERTNNVVTLDGHPLDVLSASPTELAVGLPAWLAEGVHAIRTGNNGQVSELIKFRSPGLPAPAMQSPPPPAANLVLLSWTAQLRAQYSIHGSANLTNWFTLTNGLPGTATQLNTTIDTTILGGRARFFRVLEETNVVE